MGLRFPFALLLIYTLSFLPGIKSQAQIPFEKVYSYFSLQYGRDLFQTADSGFYLFGDRNSAWRNTYILRTDKNGDTLLTKSIGTDSIQYLMYDVSRTLNNGFVTCGDYQTVLTYPTMDSYVQRLDSNGNQIWFNSFGWPWSLGGARDHGQLVKLLRDSTIIVEGMTRDLYDSVGVYESLNYQWNSYLAKFDYATGNYLNVTTVVLKLDTSRYNVKYWCSDIEVINNKIYWLGYSFDPSTFAPIDSCLAVFNSDFDTLFSLRHIGNYYGLSRTPDDHLLLWGIGKITKLDTLGNVVWTTLNSSPGIMYEINATASGEFIGIGGNTRIYLYQADFYNMYNKQKVYLNKYSPSGSLLWSNVYNVSQGVSEHLGYNVMETLDGGFAWVGMRDDDFWLVKTNSAGWISFSGIDDIPEHHVFHLYPNPAQNEITFRTEVELGSTIITLENIMGETTRIYSGLSGNEVVLPCEDVVPGIYFLRVSKNGITLGIEKILVVR